jgi:hypothetical protein
MGTGRNPVVRKICGGVVLPARSDLRRLGGKGDRCEPVPFPFGRTPMVPEACLASNHDSRDLPEVVYTPLPRQPHNGGSSCPLAP